MTMPHYSAPLLIVCTQITTHGNESSNPSIILLKLLALNRWSAKSSLSRSKLYLRPSGKYENVNCEPETSKLYILYSLNTRLI